MPPKPTLGIGLVAAAVLTASFLLLDPLRATIAAALGLAMLAITVCDLRRFIVPDVLSLPAIPAGLIAAYSLSPANLAPLIVLEHLSAALLGGLAFFGINLIYKSTRGFDGLGMGDVKLAAAAGAWTGLAGLSLVILIACAGALAYIVGLSLFDLSLVVFNPRNHFSSHQQRKCRSPQAPSLNRAASPVASPSTSPSHIALRPRTSVPIGQPLTCLPS